DLGRLSRERVKQELQKTMAQVRHPSRAMELWRSSGAMSVLLPSIDAQPAWARSAADWCAAPDQTDNEGVARRRTLVRLATLFCGLPHDAARRALRELRFSNRDGDWITHLGVCAGQLRPRVLAALRDNAAASDAELRRWASLAGRLRLADVLRVTLATLHAGGDLEPSSAARAHAVYRRALRIAFGSPVELADLAVDGDLLMREGGVPRGPALGTTLRRLLDAVLDDPTTNERERLLTLARSWSGLPTGEAR
ncbi:MAG: hypothetical protein ABIT38_15890, partial [Gemmatimonadaceae bacterium]